MPQFTDGLLLHRQTAGDDVELDPMLEGKPVDELLKVNSEAGSAAIPAPGIHRRHLFSGARHNLQCQSFQIPWVPRQAPIVFDNGYEAPMSIIKRPPCFASRQSKTALSADKEPVLLATSTPEKSGVGRAMFD